MAQFGRPISDISTGTWATTPLWSDLDDNSDTDFVTQSGNSDAFECKLASLTDPAVSTGHVVRWRAFVSTGSGGQERLTTSLYQGTTLIKQGNATAVSRTAFQTYQFSLDATQTDSITDYSDLRIRIDATSIQGSDVIDVAWCELEIPNASGATSKTGTDSIDVDTVESTAGLISNTDARPDSLNLNAVESTVGLISNTNARPDSLDFNIIEGIVSLLSRTSSRPDSINLSIIEIAVLQIFFSKTGSDSIDFSITESTPLIKAVVSTFDTINLSILSSVINLLSVSNRADNANLNVTEQSNLLLRSSRVDSLDIDITELASALLVTISRTDGINLSFIESTATLNSLLSRSDIVNVTVVESTPTLLARLLSIDDINVSVVEGISTAVVVLETTDTIDVTIAGILGSLTKVDIITVPERTNLREYIRIYLCETHDKN